MPKRKRIKNIAFSIAHSFMSRNTDIDGYWAPGIFYEQAHQHSKEKFVLDILSRDSTPKYQYSYVIADKFHEMILKQLKNNKLNENHITKATITLCFNVEPNKKHMEIYRTCGEALACFFELIDDLGKTHLAEGHGWCSRQSKHIGRRSTRRLITI